MNDLKWADVAHMYAKADFKVRIKNRGHDETFLMVSNRNIGGSYLEKYVSDGIYWKAYGAQFAAWDEHKPILRHLKDMTEAEALELYEVAWGFPMELQTSVWDSARDWFQSLWEKYTPKTTFWLYKNGFDIHGLIESEQAIRKPLD